MAAAAGVVFLLGVLKRYGHDPLGLFRGMDIEAWEYQNLLSTIGNVNWYCGYLCVALPFLLYFFWSGRKMAGILGGIGSLIGFATLFTQGSASGYVGIAGILAVLLMFSLRNREKRMRFLTVAMTFFLTPLAMTFTLPLVSKGLQLPDQMTETVIYWRGWRSLTVFTGVLLLWTVWSSKKGKQEQLSEEKIGKIRKLCLAVLLVSGSAVLLLVILCQISDVFWRQLGSPFLLRLDENWGSGRGILWRLSLRCFWQEGLLQKLFGVGPDCFACIMDKMFDMGNEIFVSGQWQGAVFANAH